VLSTACAAWWDLVEAWCRFEGFLRDGAMLKIVSSGPCWERDAQERTSGELRWHAARVHALGKGMDCVEKACLRVETG
jgi:hypothetical protein